MPPCLNLMRQHGWHARAAAWPGVTLECLQENHMNAKPITVMGIFVADLAFRTKSLPVWGETVLGSNFRLGPGGKGSNQSVAAARLGAKGHFISKVGDDNF